MPTWLVLVCTVPAITGFIGWMTNWAAVKMIFHPARFLGVGPLGWQGILYKQARKFATGIADMATENLVSARELVERLNPDELERVFTESLDEEAAAICEEAAEIIRPGAWASLPEPVRATIVAQVKAQVHQLSRELFDRLQSVSDELLDLRELIYEQLSGDNVRKLVYLTQRVGHREFKFIEYYGGVFGLLIGLGQVGIWSAMQIWWLMPIVGVTVGLVTNWLAIQMIFRPQYPRTYLGVFRYQGLFAKRQPEIAADYAEVVAREIITPRNLIGLLTKGEAGARIAAIVGEAISDKLDGELSRMQGVLPIEVTPDQLGRIKAAIVLRISATAPTVQPRIERYLENKLDIEQTIEARLARLPKPEFERVLRGVFEEDEITLILVGGFLGGVVGALQGLFVLTL